MFHDLTAHVQAAPVTSPFFKFPHNTPKIGVMNFPSAEHVCFVRVPLKPTVPCTKATWKRPPQLPHPLLHPRSVRSCLATDTEVNRGAKMVASEKSRGTNLSVHSDDSALIRQKKQTNKQTKQSSC